MAALEPTQWTIAVVVVDDVRLNKMYKMSPATKLVDLMEIWKSEFDLTGHWVFASANDDVTFDNDWMTVEMVEEAVPNSQFIMLKAELDEPKPKPVSEIYVDIDDVCHYLFVMPHEKLCDVMGRLSVRPKEPLEFDGVPLNMSDSVEQAGLRDNCIVYESPSPVGVTVKLSTGVSRVFEMSSDDHVLKLVEKVTSYETSDFSLTYQGRTLDAGDRVRDLRRGVVEVATAEFLVHVNGRRVTWRSKDEPIPFSDFISQLAMKGALERENLETMEYSCLGCQRCIRNSEDIQMLPINCCRERSLTLTAVPASDRRTQVELRDLVKSIESLCLNEEGSDGPRTAALRRELQRIREMMEKEEMDYNFAVECCEKRRIVKELQEKAKRLRLEIEGLELRDTESAEEMQVLREENARHAEDVQKLKEENSRLKAKLNDEEKEKGATAAPGPSVEQRGVQLLVFYYPGAFSPVSGRPEIQGKGEYPWIGDYVKCQVGLQPGVTPFEAVVKVLRPLFQGRKILGKRWEISSILQWRKEVAGRTLAWVTSRGDDEVAKEEEKRQFCDASGEELSWREAGQPQYQRIKEGGEVVIVAGRRTVLWISPFSS